MKLLCIKYITPLIARDARLALFQTIVRHHAGNWHVTAEYHTGYGIIEHTMMAHQMTTCGLQTLPTSAYLSQVNIMLRTMGCQPQKLK